MEIKRGGKVLTLKALQALLRAQGYEVSHSILSLVFSGKRTPSLPLFVALAQALSVSLDEMYSLLMRVREDTAKLRSRKHGGNEGSHPEV